MPCPSGSSRLTATALAACWVRASPRPSTSLRDRNSKPEAAACFDIERAFCSVFFVFLEFFGSEKKNSIDGS